MNDFEEMLLHHLATNCLYFSYIFGNMIPIGCLISFVHDIADVPGFLVKTLNTTDHTRATAATFIVTMAAWFVTRIYYFPQVIYHIFSDFAYPEEFGQFQNYIYLNGVFLTPLFLLHIYWFCLFVKILKRFAT